MEDVFKNFAHFFPVIFRFVYFFDGRRSVGVGFEWKPLWFWAVLDWFLVEIMGILDFWLLKICETEDCSEVSSLKL
jgi:hypothetical protein